MFHNLLDAFLWIWNYILYGKLVVWITLLVTIVVVVSYFTNSKLFGLVDKKDVYKKKFLQAYHLNNWRFSVFLYEFLVKFFNFLISSVAVVLSKVFAPFFKIRVFDNLIQKMFFIDTSMKTRKKFVSEEFNETNDGYWLAKERAYDMETQQSPIFYNKFMNGKPVSENYDAFMIPKTKFVNIYKEAFLIFVAAFIISWFIVSPQNTYGYIEEQHVLHNYAEKKADAITANPSISTEFRGDLWNEKSLEERKKLVEENALAMAYYELSKVNGWSYTDWGYIFKDGYLISLFFSLGCFFAYIPTRRVSLKKQYNNPYILDAFEEDLYASNQSEINNYKVALSEANNKAVVFDKNTYLFYFGTDTGLMQDKGVVQAAMKYSYVGLSLTDLKQHIFVIGGSGSGKSFSLLRPFYQKYLTLSRDLENYVLEEEKYFNNMNDTLTDVAIQEGYLNEYKEIPFAQTKLSSALMDIKAQLPNDFYSLTKELDFKNPPLLIGSRAEEGEYVFDLLASFGTPSRVISLLESINSQMGAEGKKDMWSKQSLMKLENYLSIAYLFQYTNAGLRYMTDKKMKVWSFKFLKEISFNEGNDLLAHAIYSVLEELKTMAGQIKFGHLVNDTILNAYGDLLNRWYELQKSAPETRKGVEVNMETDVAVFGNSQIEGFVSGYCEFTTDLSHIHGKNLHFKLDSDTYADGAKLVLVIAKTTIYENQKARQSRYAAYVTKYTKLLEKELGSSVVVGEDVLFMQVDKLNESTRLIHAEYVDFYASIEEQFKSYFEAKNNSRENLQQILDTYENIKGKAEYLKFPFTSDNINQVRVAIGKYDMLAPLMKGNNKSFIIKDIDLSVFKKKDGETAEEKARRELLLKYYYAYQNAKTKVSREVLLLIKDEDQQLITYSKSGSVEHDGSFLNIGRSTNTICFNLSQSLSTYYSVVDKTVATNYFAQHRTKIFLAVEDEETASFIDKFFGKNTCVSTPLNGTELLDDKKETGKKIYSSFNSALNKWQVPALNPYVFPNDFDYDTTPDFNGFMKALFFGVVDDVAPSMKRHGLDTSSIPEYKSSGVKFNDTSSHDNKEAIVNKVADVIDKAKSEYNEKKREAIKEGKDVYPIKDYATQSNSYGICLLQRSGQTKYALVNLVNNTHLNIKDREAVFEVDRNA